MHTPGSPRDGDIRRLPATPIRHRRRWLRPVLGRLADHTADLSDALAGWSRRTLQGAPGYVRLRQLGEARAVAALRRRVELVPPAARLRARRTSLAVALLLLLAIAPALAATNVAHRPQPASAAADDAPDGLAEREEATRLSSRSLLREMVTPPQAPRPAAAAPQIRPPEPEPAPEPAPEPRDEEATESSEPAETPDESSSDAVPAPIGGLSEQQMRHAATIVRVGQELGLPAQAYVVALATALQESNLRVLANPAYPESFQIPNDGEGYDHDSVGIFQQRPISGWGTVAECMDPEHSARSFYRALQEVPGWQNLPITVAAQTVQVSAFPDHYAKHEPLSRQLVDALT